MVKVKVPATSANLGAGFDSVGLAINLYNYVYMDFSNELEIKSLDDFNVPINSSNLVYKSAKHLFNYCGFKKFKSLKIEQKNNIFAVRGLGSSSACIVAGLFGANALLNFPLKKEEILNIATKLEGHPDNVAPAIFGGFVVCAVEKDFKVFCLKNTVSKKLKFVVFVPNFKTSTEKSRKGLKPDVSLKDAVFNISRTGLLISSILNEKYEYLKIAVKDRIHQDFRLKYVENGEEIFKISYELGAYAVYLSGSGPSIVAICGEFCSSFKEDAVKKLKEKKIVNWNVFNFKADENGVSSQIV